MHTNHSAQRASPTNPGIAVTRQTSRNNRFVVDGVAVDSVQTGLPPEAFPSTGVREFVVLTNTYPAEFGQASGAVVSIVTRSGTNEFASRAFYFHRDDALDATSGTARLAGVEEARLTQKTAGSFVGGPLSRDRAFMFASIEATATDNQFVLVYRSFTSTGRRPSRFWTIRRGTFRRSRAWTLKPPRTIV